MDIIINYWAVVGGAIFLFITGAIWYGPIFGKVWMRINGHESMTKEQRDALMKGMTPMYVIQFILSLVTSFVLYYFVQLVGQHVAFWIWVGFSMPMAAGAMWDSKTKELMLKKFLITASYQLVTLLMLALAFSAW